MVLKVYIKMKKFILKVCIQMKEKVDQYSIAYLMVEATKIIINLLISERGDWLSPWYIIYKSELDYNHRLLWGPHYVSIIDAFDDFGALGFFPSSPWG